MHSIYKVDREVKTKVNCKELQEALQRLGKWETMWQMEFSLNKCKEMQIGIKKTQVYANRV